jgi:hypothetical protein
MPVIWGHVESVVNQPTSSPNQVLYTKTPLGARRRKCIAGVAAKRKPAAKTSKKTTAARKKKNK